MYSAWVFNEVRINQRIGATKTSVSRIKVRKSNPRRIIGPMGLAGRVVTSVPPRRGLARVGRDGRPGRADEGRGALFSLASTLCMSQRDSPAHAAAHCRGAAAHDGCRVGWQMNAPFFKKPEKDKKVRRSRPDADLLLPAPSSHLRLARGRCLGCCK